MEMRVVKKKRWKCPFGYCSTQFDNYKEVADHVLYSSTHKHCEQYLYNKVGGFWAPIICYLNTHKKWPNVSDIFYKDEAKAKIELIQLDKTTADQMWKTSEYKHTATDIGHIRILPGSPIEDTLYFLRRRASAQTSAEPSDVERQTKHRDQSDEEVGEREETEADTHVEERRRATQPQRPPLGPRPMQELGLELLERLTDSQQQPSQQRGRGRGRRGSATEPEPEPEPETVAEEEPDTEHEVIRREEEEEHEDDRIFEPNDRIHSKIVEGMNQLAYLLKVKRIGRPRTDGPDINPEVEETEEEEAENFHRELETLLRSFQEDEIPPDMFYQRNQGPIWLIG
jgi:hypothetical protein